MTCDFGHPGKKDLLVIIFTVAAVPYQPTVDVLPGVFQRRGQQHRGGYCQTGVAGAMANPPVRRYIRVLLEDMPGGILAVNKVDERGV